ncbi:MAG: hypothetical protein P794_04455 [Epsilonproteobacteria bacterium (ex Lamellibrachia satsuma)]|nr:MAG: hypothetical protein P794_04455 [Epsilonproteobacteria bacterium (ex Lamellibrachia satsuma)]
MKLWILSLSTIFFIIGCRSQAPEIAQRSVSTVQRTDTGHMIRQSIPQRPRKKITLKKVEDDNFSEAYMYPEDKGKKEEKIKKVKNIEANSTSSTLVQNMTKEECIGMIGQKKFDKYTQLFGNEASSIKRCAMLKAMQ